MTKTARNASLNTLVQAYFKAVDNATARRADMKPALDKLEDRAARVTELMPLYATYMGAVLVDGKPEGGKAGQYWKAWCAAKSRIQRDLNALYGDEGKEGTGGKVKEAIEVPAHIAKLAKALAAACAEYDNHKSLAAQAVAEAW